MSKIATIPKVALAAAACFLLVSCGGNKIQRPDPTPLGEFEQFIELKQNWSYSHGPARDNLSTLLPYFGGGRAYMIALDGNVAALDLSSGRRAWSVKHDYRVSAGIGFGDGVLVFATADGEIVGISSHDGAQFWQHSTGQLIISPPLVTDGKAYARTIDGRLIALDANTGAELWSADFYQPNFTVRDTTELFAWNNSIVIGNASGRVIATDAVDGITNWQISTGDSARSADERLENVNVDAVIVGNAMYAVSVPSNIVAYDLIGQRVLWTRNMSTGNRIYASSLAVVGYSEDSEVFALNRLDGTTVWRQGALRHRGVADIEIVGERMIVADKMGVLHVLSLIDGAILGRSVLRGQRVLTRGLHVIGDDLYVSLASGRLLAFALEPR